MFIYFRLNQQGERIPLTTMQWIRKSFSIAPYNLCWKISLFALSSWINLSQQFKRSVSLSYSRDDAVGSVFFAKQSFKFTSISTEEYKVWRQGEHQNAAGPRQWCYPAGCTGIKSVIKLMTDLETSMLRRREFNTTPLRVLSTIDVRASYTGRR